MSDLDTVFISTVETAVTTSVAQNKPLIVFNTDGSEQSTEWVGRLLTEDLLKLISEKAVALKLVKDTTQFALFEQIFPNVIIPSFYCIKVSAILDIIHGEINEEGFKERMEKVLIQSSSPVPLAAQASNASASQQEVQNQQPSQPQQRLQQGTSEFTPQLSQTQGSPLLDTASPTPSTSITPNVSRNDGSPSVPQSPKPTTSGKKSAPKREYRSMKEEAAEMAAKKYKEEQLKKRQQEREDRERIRRLLKADQDERKLDEKRKNEERDRLRRLSNQEEILDDAKINEILTENQSLRNNIRGRRQSTSLVCALSIRLLDGSSLRHDFMISDTLNDVRKWIDENRTDSEEPYCFHRTIPRATFGVTDEEKTLESLELTPRSALILKPFNTYATAYNGAGTTSNASRGGLLSRVFGGLSSLWYGEQGHRINENGDDIRGSDSIEEDDDLIDPTSPLSSSYVSPAPTPRNFNDPAETNRLDLLHPSALNLNLNLDQVQRPVSPQASLQGQELPARTELPASLLRMNSSQSSWIRTLNDGDSDDRLTYNGNHINLEDDSKKK